MKPAEQEAVSGQSMTDTQARFDRTSWTLVFDGAGCDPAARNELCRIYWPPLYAFLRRAGHSTHDAQDLVQGFLAHLLAKDSRLQSVHPTKGRFRTFLLACLKNYVSNHPPGSPRHEFISIDLEEAETFCHGSLVETTTPDQEYDRAWALTVHRRALALVRQEWERRNEGKTFDLLVPFIADEAERGDYAKVAKALGEEEGTVRVKVSRLRTGAYRDAVRAVIAGTVDNESDIGDELRRVVSTGGAAN